MSHDRRLARKPLFPGGALVAAAATLVLWPAIAQADTTLQGEGLTLKPASAGQRYSDGAADGGMSLKMWSNASATGTVITSGGASQLVVRARGQQCSGAPRLVASVDGVDRLTAAVSSSGYADYPASLMLSGGPHSISVAFVNDVKTKSCDRNVLLDTVVLKGVAGPGPAPQPTPTPVPTPAPTSTPTPAPSPTPVTGRLIKAASFEGTTSEVNLQQATSGRIAPVQSPAVEGRYSLHFQVRNGDRWNGDSGKNRSEALIEADRGYDPHEGDDYWHRWWFRVPASTPMPTNDHDNLHITQTKSNDNREYMAGFTFRAGRGLTFVNSGGTLWELPISQFQRDRWYKVLWHSHLSTNPSKGYDELWVDDQKVGMQYAKTLAQSGNYMKFGLYRLDSGQGTADIYYDGLRIATSRAMAEAG